MQMGPGCLQGRCESLAAAWHFFCDLASVLSELCRAVWAAGSAVPRGQSSSSVYMLVLCGVSSAFWAEAPKHFDCKDKEL